MNQTTHRAARRAGPRSERGSALILVLLILLALSAIGMAALQDITRSISQSGHFRARTNANLLSEAATSFVLQYYDDNPGELTKTTNQIHQMRRRGQLNQGPSYSGNREAVETLGKYQELVHNPDGRADFDTALDITGGETGLFVQSGGASSSFETREGATQFRVIVRDTLSTFPAPEAGRGWCYTRVVVATRAQIGNPGSSWSQPRQVGVETGIVEAMVGPTQQNCPEG